MRARQTIAILTFSMILLSLVPMAEAQGSRAQSRGPVRFEWTAPEGAKSPNRTIALTKEGAAEATFRIGWSGSSGGGGGATGFTNFFRYCQAGTKLVIPILVDTKATAIAPHMVSITPDKATFDISTQPAPPSMGGSGTRWSENHKLSVHYEVANITLSMVTLNLTTGPSSITGPGCQPSAPSVTSVANSYVNFTLPAKPAPATVASVPEDTPAPGLASIVLVGLVVVVFLGRRTKG